MSKVSASREHLIAAKQRFVDYRMHQFRPAVEAIKPEGLSTLEALTALREALPSPYSDFRSFETSREWSFKKACQVFDRAINAPAAGG